MESLRSPLAIERLNNIIALSLTKNSRNKINKILSNDADLQLKAN